jgi:hypothetical protein
MSVSGANFTANLSGDLATMAVIVEDDFGFCAADLARLLAARRFGPADVRVAMPIPPAIVGLYQNGP